MSTAWNWQVFLEPTPAGGTYLGWLGLGLATTAALSLVSFLAALLVGTGMGVLRTAPSRALRALGTAYAEAFRNVPLLVQLFLWYFALPEIVPAGFGAWMKGLHPFTQQFVAAAACLSLFTGARICEQVRAGIGSLSGGQRPAALALGLTLPRAYRHVLLPLAFRIILPPLTSELVNVVKNSAVASTIGLLELAAQGRQLGDYTAHAYESFLAVTLLYALLNLAAQGAMRAIEARARIPGTLGARGGR